MRHLTDLCVVIIIKQRAATINIIIEDVAGVYKILW